MTSSERVVVEDRWRQVALVVRGAANATVAGACEAFAGAGISSPTRQPSSPSGLITLARQAALPSGNRSEDVSQSENNDEIGDAPIYEKEGWKGALCVHYKRLMASDVGTVHLHSVEYKWLIDRRKYGPRGAQYLAWRGSLLRSGVFFFACVVALDVATWIDPFGINSSDSMFGGRVDPRYLHFFDDLKFYNWLMTCGKLTSSFFAVICAGIGAASWTRFRISRAGVQTSFAFSYIPLFALLLFIPFRSGVDFLGIQQQMCQDLMNRTQTPSSLWPRQAGEIAQQLLTERGLELPSGFCQKPPDEWGPSLTQLLQDSGFVLDVNSSCPAAKELVKTSIDASVHVASANGAPMPHAECPQACQNCTRECLPYLYGLGVLASVSGAQALGSVSTLSGVAASCTHCFSPQLGLQCPKACPEMVTVLVAEAFVPAGMHRANVTCIRPTDLQGFEDLVHIGTRTAYWELLLGLYYAVLAFVQLLPVAFSLMFGAAKGSEVAKSVIPQSRLPGVVSYVVAVCLFPFLSLMAVCVQSFVGSPWTLVGLISMLVAAGLKFHPGMLRLHNHKELHQENKILKKSTMGLTLFSVIMFLIAAFRTDFTAIASQVLERQGLHVSEQEFKAMREQMILSLSRAFATLFGKSLVGAVFFADSCVSLMYMFHHGEENDPFDDQVIRMTLVDEIGSLMERGVSRRTNKVTPVCPVEVGPTAQNPRLEEQETTPANSLEALLGILRQGQSGFTTAVEGSDGRTLIIGGHQVDPSTVASWCLRRLGPLQRKTESD